MCDHQIESNMNKNPRILLLTLLAALVLGSTTMAQQFTTQPEYPKPGESFTVTYDPTGGPLQGLEISVSTYVIDIDDEPPLQAIEVEWKNENGKLTAQIPTEETTRLVVFSFKNEEQDKKDNNQNTGYKVQLYDKSRNPVAGSNGAKAMMYARYFDFAGIDQNNVKALNLLKREFKEHPVSATYEPLLSLYAFLAKTEKDEEALAFVRKKAEEYASVRKNDEDKLNLAYGLFKVLEDQDQLEKLEKKIVRKFPSGRVALVKADSEFRSLETLAEKEAFYQKAIKSFDITSDTRKILDSWIMEIARLYAQQKNWSKFEQYLDMLSNAYNAVNMLNNYAWDLAGGGLDGKPENLEIAARLSKKSLDLLDEEMKTMANRPEYFTSAEWKENLNYSKAIYADTYALILYKQGKPKEALDYQELSCEAYHWNDPEINERYCVYHEKALGKPAETEAILERLIAKGKSTPAMKEQHKRLFMANNTLETAYQKFMNLIDEKVRESIKQELRKKMIDEPAPAFTLKNLKGEEVDLESLRGKVVVLDFWATWCGPCKASFPGMQKAVDKFANDPNVVFLFVDTWENTDDMAKKAGDFIKANNYTFNVLLDTENKVVRDYGVRGIPTKFVIDKEGRIRFKSVGFGGSTDALVDELTFMIELAGHTNGAVSSVP